MKFQNKKLKFFRIKKYLKNSDIFLIYTGTNIKNFVMLKQKYNKLDLTCYNIHNNLMRSILKRSIYKNYLPLINNLTILMKPNMNFSKTLTIKNLLGLNNSYILIALKINTKIYPAFHLTKSLQLNFRNNHILVLRLLKYYLKSLCKLT